MPVFHSCKDCILDGESLSYDRPVKLQDHEKQKTHQMVEQAYKRGVQQGLEFAEAEAKHAAHLPAGSCAQEPQEHMLARWLYIQAFEDGKQAAQVEHNLVMKAIVDTHNAQLGIVFKRGQDSKAVAGEAPEVEPHEHVSSATPTAAVPVAPYVYDPLASPASHASTSQLEPQPEEGAQLACPTPEEPTNQLELLPEEGGQLTFEILRKPLSQPDLHPETGCTFAVQACSRSEIATNTSTRRRIDDISTARDATTLRNKSRCCPTPCSRAIATTRAGNKQRIGVDG